jgi:hypothetical protein
MVIMVLGVNMFRTTHETYMYMYELYVYCALYSRETL